MVYNGDPGETNRAVVTLEVDQFSNANFQVVDPGVTIFAQSPCFQGANNSTMQCPADFVADFSASLGDGDDSIRVLADLSTSIGAGAGADTMVGGPAPDYLRGGQGGDSIDGGADDDLIIGDDPDGAAGGNDSLSGGAGNDSIDGQPGDDTIRGQD